MNGERGGSRSAFPGLPGEVVLEEAAGVRLRCREGDGSVPGTLVCTNLRVAFLAAPGHGVQPPGSVAPLQSEHNVALPCIRKLVAGSSFTKPKVLTAASTLKFIPEELLIFCRDFRLLRFHFHENGLAPQAYRVANAIAQARETATWPGDSGDGDGRSRAEAKAEEEEEEEGEDEEGSVPTLLFESLRDWEKELKRQGAAGWRPAPLPVGAQRAPGPRPQADVRPLRGAPRAPAVLAPPGRQRPAEIRRLPRGLGAGRRGREVPGGAAAGGPRALRAGRRRRAAHPGRHPARPPQAVGALPARRGGRGEVALGAGGDALAGPRPRLLEESRRGGIAAGGAPLLRPPARAVRPGPQLPAGLPGAAPGGPPRPDPAGLPEPGAARVGGSRPPLSPPPRPAARQPPGGGARVPAVPGLHVAAGAAVPGGLRLHRGVPAGPARQRLPALLRHLPLQLPAPAGPRRPAAAPQPDLHAGERLVGPPPGQGGQRRQPPAPGLGLGAALQPAAAGAVSEPGGGPQHRGTPRHREPPDHGHARRCLAWGGSRGRLFSGQGLAVPPALPVAQRPPPPALAPLGPLPGEPQRAGGQLGGQPRPRAPPGAAAALRRGALGAALAPLLPAGPARGPARALRPVSGRPGGGADAAAGPPQRLASAGTPHQGRRQPPGTVTMRDGGKKKEPRGGGRTLPGQSRPLGGS